MGYRKGDYFTDARFALVEHLLPGRRGQPGRHADNRLFLEAVFYVARENIPWRALPKRFGKWSTAHTRFVRWRLDDRWATVLRALRRAGHMQYRWDWRNGQIVVDGEE